MKIRLFTIVHTIWNIDYNRITEANEHISITYWATLSKNWYSQMHLQCRMCWMNSKLLRCIKCVDQKVSNRWSFEPCVPVFTVQTCVRRLPPRQWLRSQSNWCHLLSVQNNGSNRRHISNPDFIDHHRNYAIASVIVRPNMQQQDWITQNPSNILP